MIPIIERIQNNLTDNLRKAKYQGHPNKFWGHCYIASEAVYHYWGKDRGFKPQVMKMIIDGVEGTHWFLRRDGEIVDPTKDQFDFEVDYTNGKGCGFLTKHPSKRCMELMRKVIYEIEEELFDQLK